MILRPLISRIDMDIQLDKIGVDMSKAQYNGMVAWVREFDRFEKARKYRKWKPSCPVKGK